MTDTFTAGLDSRIEDAAAKLRRNLRDGYTRGYEYALPWQRESRPAPRSAEAEARAWSRSYVCLCCRATAGVRSGSGGVTHKPGCPRAQPGALSSAQRQPGRGRATRQKRQPERDRRSNVRRQKRDIG